jgi:hypothetical protein
LGRFLYKFSAAFVNPISESHLIRDVFSVENNKVLYEYDFGDSWLHEILLEKILPTKLNIRYPICVAGKRACPPEDCGGVPGYCNLLQIIKNPKHKEYRLMMDWLGKKFSPEKFDLKEICFADDK